MPNAQVSTPIVLNSVELAAVAISGSATDLTTGTLPNARLSEVPNSALADSSITVAGHTVSLGGSQNLTASDLTNGTTGSGSVVLADGPTISGLVLASTYVTTGSTYDVLANDYSVQLLTTITSIILPAASSKHGPVTIIDVGGTFAENPCTFTISGGGTISGVSSITSSNSYQVITFWPVNNTGGYIIQ